MTAINIEIDDRRVRLAVDRLRQAGEDFTPAMAAIAGHLEAGVQKRFRTRTKPTGGAWAALRETTKARRRKTGHVPIRILEQSGDLASSIQAFSDKTSAVVGTNIPYAATHQFGARKGAFGRFSVIARVIRGKYTRLKSSPTVQVPWGDIPARPFLGLSANDRKHIIDTINQHLSEQWR